MADHYDELNRRRQERLARQEAKRKKQRLLRIQLILAGIVLVAAGVAILLLTGNSSGDAQAESEVETTTAPVETTEATTKATEESTAAHGRSSNTTIHIKATGDLNISDSVVLAGAGAGGYDFSPCFQDVAGLLSDANLTIMNIEGNFCGEPYGTSTTSAPIELARALKDAGVDIVQMANSCSVNNGISGLTKTLTNLRSVGLEPVGAWASSAEFEKSKGYTICDVQGIKVAVVAFTKGVGSRGLPTGSEDCVNLLYTDYATTYEDVDTDGIKRILRDVAAEKPDITIALLHWGSEYNDTISSTQEKIITLMQKQGVDVIIGTHPHLVQQISYDKSTGSLVAYSLGDFFGDASRSGTSYSIILDLEITKDADSDTTRVTGYSYTPVYTLTENEAADGQRQVVRIQEAMLAYDANYMDKISASAYESMAYSLERIESRIKGK